MHVRRDDNPNPASVSLKEAKGHRFQTVSLVQSLGARGGREEGRSGERGAMAREAGEKPEKLAHPHCQKYKLLPHLLEVYSWAESIMF